MAHQMIKTEVVGRVGVITHNRPDKLNALHPTMTRERLAQIEAVNAFLEKRQPDLHRTA